MLGLPVGLEQVIVIFELGAVSALLVWAAARLNWLEPESHPPRLRAIGAAFMRVLALGCGASALAAAAGYLDLAEFLGVGLFYVIFVSFVALALRVVVEQVLTIGLARGPVSRLHVVSHHRALLERRVRRAIDLAVVALWLWIILGHFDLLAPVDALLRGVLEARLNVGELDLPVARVLGFLAVLTGVYLITRLVVLVLEDDVYSRMTLPRGVPYALSTLTRYGLLLTGFLLALGTLGFDLTRITVLLSAFGLGIGFGLQQIINNFVSGLILLFERSVQVGDAIQLGDLGGDVQRIGMRSSTLKTPQGAEVIVPNSTIIQDKVTNWTLSDRRRRIDLDVGVTGDTDPERIIALMGDIARRDPRVSSDPPPEALLMRFGEASADFQLRFWTDQSDWVRLRSDLGVALQRALRAVRVQDSTPPAAKETPS
jgi:small-conductance mechanosensitive channel